MSWRIIYEVNGSLEDLVNNNFNSRKVWLPSPTASFSNTDSVSRFQIATVPETDERQLTVYEGDVMGGR